MSKTMSIAGGSTSGARNHLVAVIATLIAVAWSLSFAGPAQARVILDDTSVREARSYDLSSLQESIRADGWDGHHAATLRELTDPSYGHPQAERDFTPVETQASDIDDGVNLVVVTALALGALGAAVLVAMMTRRRAVTPA
jgi:hypothetical protein